MVGASQLATAAVAEAETFSGGDALCLGCEVKDREVRFGKLHGVERVLAMDGHRSAVAAAMD